MNVNQTYHLNLVPGGVPLHIPASQYDAGIRQLIFKLYRDAEPVELPEDASVTMDGIKPDGKCFSYSAAVSGSSRDQVAIHVRQQMAAVSGDIPCRLTIRQGSTVIGSAAFILAVEGAPIHDDSDLSQSEIAAVETMAAAAAQSVADAAESAGTAQAAAAAAAASAQEAQQVKGTCTGNLDELTSPGVYWCNLADCTNGPLSSGSGYLEVCKASSLTWFQRFTRWMSAGGPCVAIRFWSHAAGAFMSWAWDSPSMASGTEYLTTERWGGSPVYTKIVDCGTTPSKTGKEIAHGAAAATVIRVCGAMSNGRSLPFANTDSGVATVSADKTNIILKTDYDSVTTAVVQIWYTKD